MTTDSIKLIWSRIPKKLLSSILAFILAYLGTLFLDYNIRQEPFKLSKQGLEALIISVILLLSYYLVAFVYYIASRWYRNSAKQHARPLSTLRRGGRLYRPRRNYRIPKWLLEQSRKSSYPQTFKLRLFSKRTQHPMFKTSYGVSQSARLIVPNVCAPLMRLRQIGEFWIRHLSDIPAPTVEQPLISAPTMSSRRHKRLSEEISRAIGKPINPRSTHLLITNAIPSESVSEE